MQRLMAISWVAWLFAGLGGVVILFHNGRLGGAEAFPDTVAVPEVLGRRKLVQWQFGFNCLRLSGAVVKDESVAIRAEDERDIQGGGVVERLLHGSAGGMRVVFGFDDGEGNAWFVGKDVVGAFGIGADGNLAANDDAAFSEREFLAVWSMRSQFAATSAGVMNLVQISRSETAFFRAMAWQMRARVAQILDLLAHVGGNGPLWQA